ncbi:DUF6441 family protein [Roseibium sediminicola]|uniref:DUF6441 family protein n=1 Tax=Roseibium sediminicola TaxID=2933272 RepID=A0ABT0H0H0_9HYPH|nr:DUF6441 family protein [Roseibium sp. CAU 1639]MCK7615184.1 DUF6441 family protein [Roseibium sp. CAU 1639]
MTDLRLALVGDLQKHLDAEEKEISTGLRLATEDVAVLGKTRFRQQTTAAGLGRKLAKAWRHNVYPRHGVQTLEPAALVFTKAPEIVRAFDEGQTIRPRKASFLAIPTDFAPKSRRRLSRGRRMGIDEFREAFGKDALSFVASPEAPGSVVFAFANQGFRRSRGKRGGSRRVKAGGKQKSERVLMFVLVKQVRLSKRLDVSSIETVLRRRYPDLITRRLIERLS